MTGLLHERVASAFRAVADNPACEVKVQTSYYAFDNSQATAELSDDLTQAIVTTPEIQKPDSLEFLRGTSDAAALQVHYTDVDIFNNHRPPNPQAETLYRMLEATRAQMLGTQYMPGVRANIMAAKVENLKQQAYHEESRQLELPIEEAVSLSLMAKGMEPEHIPPVIKELVDRWHTVIDAMAGKELEQMLNVIDDQEQFAKLSTKLYEKLEMGSQQPDGDGEEEPPEASKATAEEEQYEESENLDAMSSAEVQQESQPLPPSDDGSGTDDEADGEAEPQRASGDQSDGAGEYTPPNPSEWQQYYVYTTEFDETLPAFELASQEELTRLRNQLDTALESVKDITSRLAAKLQRKLLSLQTRSWDYNMEEGILDPSKLPALIIDPSFPTPYKWERNRQETNTIVSLLIDNSGSMRGRPIMVAALCADILARTLERCGITTEILGFTTKEWKGGQSRKMWQAAGQHERPGRLNDLRHIIYKSANTSWRKARKQLGLMLKEGLLKENIDGEALLWANDRLMARPEPRKILMVISDGAPVDDSTLSTNTGSFLDQHLREVIHTIVHNDIVELVAIGIGHDVTSYYPKAVTIRDVDQLGDAMVKQLSMLFEEGSNSGLRAKTR